MVNIDYIKLGKILQEARSKLGLKQSEIAVKVDCTSSNISSWERGKSKIDIDSFASLCKIYNIDFATTLNKIVNDKKTALTETDESNKDKQRLLHNYENLNDNGKKKLLDYSDDLVSSGKYVENDTNKQNIVKMLKVSRSFDDTYKPQIVEDDINDFINAPESDLDL